jgi:mercuric ion transport protein
VTRGMLIGVGAAGSLVAAICCATPALAVLLGALGLSAWLAWSDYLVLPALLAFLGVAAFGLMRRQGSGVACHEAAVTRNKGSER